MNLEDLDFEDVRKIMDSEINLDIGNDRLYMSKRLKSGYEDKYTHLLLDATVDGDSNSLSQCILNENCLSSMEPSARSRTGQKKVPKDAHITLAEGEFNRFYIRALCIKAIAQRYELEIYRAKHVQRPRSASQELIGTTVNPNKLLEDLRKNVGVDTALGIPAGPNSGLSVRIRRRYG
ncbi:hypothetical protein [Methanobacterium alcaliphilum]|uniref:hypothetical protein n=1 Tax=Methanobacterium alcaliphilum TaxID=392018 RepID=UPI00200B30D3|nr:hypothetical protein [Methanobacterium alcaliphilum]MCK9151381.1 hypothetical protein [Methanobacterium alcaliphilum]